MAGRTVGRPRKRSEARTPAQVAGLRSPTIIERLRDARGLGPSFPDLAPWRRWLALARLLYGLPLARGDREVIAEHTSAEPRPGVGYRTAAIIVGRQSGKSTIAAAIAAHEALSARSPHLGEVYSLLVSQDERQATRVAFAYARDMIERSPIYRRRLLTEPRKLELSLDSMCSLRVLPCDAASLRGYRAVAVVLDECAFFGDSVAESIVEAARPCLASTGGRLILVSSPGAPSGLLFDLARRQDPHTLVWRGASFTMNPEFPPELVEELRRHDPLAFRREVLGEFGATSSTLLDPQQVEGACREDATHLAPREGVRYEAFVDLSGGRVDRAALAVVHVESGRAVVDALHAWSPPFSPQDFVESCTPILARYNVRAVRGDFYGAELQADAWRRAGVQYERSALTASQLFVSLVPVFAGGLVELPRDPLLIEELKALERRTTGAGRDLARHPRDGHDDLAAAVAGAVVHALRWRPDPFATWRKLLSAEERSYAAPVAA